MPSQISLRTPPVLSGSEVQLGKAVPETPVSGENDKKEVVRSVGSLLVTHNSILKPQTAVTINLNGSCGRADALLPRSKFSTRMALANGSASPFVNLETNHYSGGSTQYMNGTSETPPPRTSFHHSSHPHKTEGEHSNERSSLTSVCPLRGRLMCPDSAINYSGKLIRNRASCLANKQRELEARMALLQHRVRTRQLKMAHSHASKQLDFSAGIEQGTRNVEDSSFSSITVSDFSSTELSPVTTHVDAVPQMDGASDDAFLPYESDLAGGEGVEVDRGRVRNNDSFCSLDSFASSWTSETEEGGVQAIRVQVTSLQCLLDEDLTDESSDEEGGESADISNRQVIPELS